MITLKSPYEIALMRKAGFIDKLGEDNFCAHIDAALARAEELLGEEK